MQLQGSKLFQRVESTKNLVAAMIQIKFFWKDVKSSGLTQLLLKRMILSMHRDGINISTRTMIMCTGLL